MRHAKIFSLVVFSALLAYGAIGFLCLPLASFEGDLTRMGMVPESHYGWTREQPALEPEWFTQSDIQEADVLVIGDSFSVDRTWQTVLTRSGLRVHTRHWHDVQGICGDFDLWLRQQGFKGKHLIIQIVERNRVKYANRSLNCSVTRSKYKPAPRRTPPPRIVDRAHRSYDGKMSVGLRTWFNGVRQERRALDAQFTNRVLNDDVRIARVENGCSLFSHRQCSEALFLNWDKPEDIGEATLAEIATINQRVREWTPLWAIVPNKSTVYLQSGKTFWDRAEQQFHAPNLLRIARQAIDAGTVDLYPGNNTHFSTTGYLLMGETLKNALDRR